MPEKTDDQTPPPEEETPPPAEETPPPAEETPAPAEVVEVEVEKQIPPSFANWTQAEKDEVHEFIKQSRENEKRQTEERESARREESKPKPKRGLRFKQRRK